MLQNCGTKMTRFQRSVRNSSQTVNHSTTERATFCRTIRFYHRLSHQIPSTDGTVKYGYNYAQPPPALRPGTAQLECCLLLFDIVTGLLAFRCHSVESLVFPSEISIKTQLVVGGFCCKRMTDCIFSMRFYYYLLSSTLILHRTHRR